LRRDRGDSLRSIAAEAGYPPGTIYQYFSGHRSLLLAITEEDMLAAVIAFERIAARESDPELPMQQVFPGVARLLPKSLNWLSQVRTMLALGCTTSAMKARIGYISPGLAG
jgi:AcrR family transcriptional regulator